jgi:hypothetical protein
LENPHSTELDKLRKIFKVLGLKKQIIIGYKVLLILIMQIEQFVMWGGIWF